MKTHPLALTLVSALLVSGHAGAACFADPVSSPVITSVFGMRTHPVDKVWKGHKGVDLRAAVGTQLFSAKTGKVSVSKFSETAGNMVIINDGNTLNKYFHLTQRTVKEGDMLRAGQPIGTSGNTGKSSAPHLHFEYHSGGNPVDPAPYLCNATMKGGGAPTTPPPANTDFKNMPSEDEHGNASSNPDQSPRASTMADQAASHFSDSGAQIERAAISDNLPMIKEITLLWAERMKIRAMRLEKTQNVEALLAIRLADKMQERDAILLAARSRLIAGQANNNAKR